MMNLVKEEEADIFRTKGIAILELLGGIDGTDSLGILGGCVEAVFQSLREEGVKEDDVQDTLISFTAMLRRRIDARRMEL